MARLWLLVLVGCYDPAQLKVGADATGEADGTAADGAATADASIIDAFCPTVVGPYSSDFSLAGVLPSGTGVYDAGPNVFAEVSGGAFRVVVPAESAVAYAGLYSISAFDFRNMTLLVHLVDPPAGPDGEALFGISNGGTLLGFALTGPLLRYGLEGSFATQTWNTAETWWRVQDDGAQVALHVSQDGRTWRMLTAVSQPAWIATADLDLDGGAYTAHAFEDQVVFDDLNWPPCDP